MRLGAADFAGRWRLERRITDHRGGPESVLRGEVYLEPVAGGLEYRERGSLRLGDGPPLEAERRYFWAFIEGEVRVRFADGAPFHAFVPAGKGAGTPHPCGDDLYQCAYDFTAWPRWRVTWRVRGPRKDYLSVSEHAPLEAAHPLGQNHAQRVSSRGAIHEHDDI